MQFLADESCDGIIVHTLRNLGYDVNYIAESNASASDNIMMLWLQLHHPRFESAQ